MKVLHIHFGKEGGAERFFVNLANALCDRGVEQEIMMRPARSWQKDVERCGRIHLGTFQRVSLSRFWLQWRLRSILRRFQPDVIMAWQLRASRFMPRHERAFRISRLGDYPEHLDYYRNVETLVCITPDMAARVREMGWTRDIEVIPNFTRAKSAAPVARAVLDTPADAFTVVAMGRFVPRKGFDHLLRAMAKIDGAYLWLLGDGPEGEALNRLADELGIADRVRMPGWKTDAYAYLAAGDAFAITSLHEPLGNVCFEGWGAGVPTVASRAEGPSFAMRDGIDALLVDKGDADQLAAALKRLRDESDLRATLVAGGREALAMRFSEDAITGAYLQLFRSGLKGPRA